MLVSQTTHSCIACNSEAEYNIEVNIPLEEIKLTKHAVACECGYFKERTHSPVSFSNWKAEKLIIKSRAEGCKSYINSLQEEMNSEVDTIRKGWIKDWIVDEEKKLKGYQEKDILLGAKPVPNSLFNQIPL